MNEPSGGLGSVPLVGRERELAWIEERVERRPPGSVLISGEAGVGKTRLAAEMIHQLQERGSSVLRVRASRSAQEVPLGALAPHLPLPAGGDDPWAETLGRAARALIDHTGGNRVVLVAEDVQWLDRASAEVLAAVVEGGELLIATLRTGEGVPDAIEGLLGADSLERLPLEPLAKDTTGPLAEALLGASLDGASRDRLWRATLGSPLHLREVLAAADRHGRIVRRDGGAELTAVPDPSARLVDIVRERLHSRDPDEHSALVYLALADVLSKSALDGQVGQATVTSLLVDGLITEEIVGRRCQLRLAHPVHGDVLRADLGALERQPVLARLAESIRATGARRREDLLRMTVWRLEAGVPDDPATMVGAGRLAHFAHDEVLAERLARLAAEKGEHRGAALLLGQTLYLQGRPEEAATVLGAAEGVDDEERALLAMTAAEVQAWGLGRRDAALSTLVACRRDLTSPRWIGEVTAAGATYHLLGGAPAACLAEVEPLFTTDDARTLTKAAVAGAPALTALGRCDDAADLGARGLAARLGLGDQEAISDAAMLETVRAAALYESGRVKEALAAATAGYDASAEFESPTGMAWFALIRGASAAHAGLVETAVRAFREAADRFAAIGHPANRRWALSGLLAAVSLRGDPEAVDRAVCELDEAEAPAVLLFEPETERARGWAALALGDRAGARAHLVRSAQIAREARGTTLELAAWHDLVRQGQGGDDCLAAADRMDGKVQGVLGAGRVSYIRAVSAGDGDRLEDLSEEFSGGGMCLFAAESMAQAGVAKVRTSLTEEADEAFRRANELASLCEGACTPALVLDPGTARLTEREHEVAGLAADGESNRSIAGKMSISEHTVERHLTQVYAKLETDRRSLVGRLNTQGR